MASSSKRLQMIVLLLDENQTHLTTGALVNIVDRDIEIGSECFMPIYRLGHIIFPSGWSDIQQIETQCDFLINALDDWLICKKVLL